VPHIAEPSPEVRDSPIYWFTILEIARDRGDYSLAAEADRELRRLGVRVVRDRRTRQAGGGRPCPA
jgi:hypothetical protein